MASEPFTSGLLKLEEQLTCPVCLDLYTNPKTLPCLHSFCEACIERFPQDKEGETYYLSCPTCRHCTELPGGGAGAFPAAFTLNNLKDVHSLMKKVADPQQVTCDNCTAANATGYCKDCSKFLCQKCINVHKEWAPFAHHQITSFDEMTASISFPSQLLPTKKEPIVTCSVPSHDEPLKYYCDMCDESICRDCAMLTHKDHKYSLLADIYAQHVEDLEHSLKPLKGKIEELQQALLALTEREGEISERGEGVLKEIHDTADEMVDALRRSERKIADQAKMVIDAKLKVLSEQTKSAQTSLSVLKDIEDYVEQSLKTGTHQQVLRSKKQIMERINEVTTHDYNVEELEPKEKADFSFVKDSKIAESLQHIGDIVTHSSTALQRCRVKKIIPDLRLSNRERLSFSLSIEAPDLSLLSVPISSLKCSVQSEYTDEQPVQAAITATSAHPGVYRMHIYHKTFRGNYTVRIQVNDVQLEDTLLFIPFNPYLENITFIAEHNQVEGPWGIALSDDLHLVLTELKGGIVSIVDCAVEGTPVRIPLPIINPRGVAITPDNCFIVSGNDTVSKFNMKGTLVSFFHEENSLFPKKFDGTRGVAISPTTGQVYVADWVNHRIQVLNPDLTFSRSFGSKGSANGQFLGPCNIATDTDGSVYVTDSGNHRVQKFTPDEQFVVQFGGGKGAGLGQLDKPTGIAIDNAGTGLVYVSEAGNSRISVFTSDCDFLSCLGEKSDVNYQFKNPLGMAFNKRGLLYICDYRNDRIVIY